jgi:hypothetical protein
MNADAAAGRRPSPDQTAEARPAACPSCGAAVRQDVPWCLQCYASLLPEPEQKPEQKPELEPEPTPAPVAVAVGRDGAPPAPGEASAVGVALAPGELDAVADRMLAELAAQRDPQPRWASRLPGSRGGRAAVLAGVIAAAVAVLVAIMSLVGLFL